MRPRTIRIALHTVALLWIALAAAPKIAHADPAIDTLSPTSISAGTGSVTLTITGSGFDTSSQVRFNGDLLAPASVTPAQITVTVPAADTASGGYMSVSVVGASAESPFKLFTVQNNAPQIAALVPSTAFAGGNFFTLTLIGSGFNAQTQVIFGPDQLTPDTVSPTQLTVTVPAGEIVNIGPITISAVNPDPVTGSSNTQTFTVMTPVPVLASVAPSAIVAGSPDTTITLTGQNFRSASTAQWNGAPLATTLMSPASLTAVVPAANLSSATTANVTVSDPDYGVSGAVSFVVTPPAPTALSLSPSTANSSDPDFTLTVNGVNFLANSTIKWGNTVLTTTFVSATQLTAVVSSNFVWTPITAPITVTTPINGKTVVTAPLTFTVNASIPTISTLNPATKVAGSAGFTLNVTGAKCLKGAVINWNGTPLPTTIISSGFLTANISADMIATAGTAAVTLTNVGASAPSKPLTFQITPQPTPKLTSLNPSTVSVGAADTQITISGSSFRSSCVAQWNGVSLPTTFVSDSSLTAVIPAADLAAATSANITVSDPDAGVSNALPFTVTAPTALSLSPNSANSGDPDFTLTVNGANFLANSAIKWGDTILATTLVSSSKLSATIPAALVSAPGSVSVTVTTPIKGAAIATAALTFTVNASVPTITALTPSSEIAGDPGFMLSVTGARCLPGATINWNGAPLPTTFVSSSLLTASVSADKIANSGTASITLSNPGAAPSAALSFPIAVRPIPAITALTPNSAPAKSPDVTILLSGAYFNSRSAVRWNGAPLPTTFVSASALTATIPAANIAAAGSGVITVSDPNYGVSNGVLFTITAPIPVALSLSPNSIYSGASDFTLTVNGSDFQPGSVIRWSNMSLPTTFVSPTQLTATVAASMVWTPTTAPVVVCTTLSGKMVATAPLTFTVNPSTPIISTLNPPSKVAGAAAFTLTVTGAKCLKGATINWNGAPLATTIISSGMLQANISPDMIANAGSVAVTLSNAGSAPSVPLTFQILPRIAPTITSLSPNSAAAQSRDIRLSVSGTGFTRNSSVCWNGAPLTTAFVSAATLVAIIPTSDLTTPGSAAVTVSDPDYGVSTPAAFTVTALPTLTALSPNAAKNGDPDFTLTVTGTNFQASSVVWWTNMPLATTFVSANKLTATVPAAFIGAPNTFAVTVTTLVSGKSITTAPLSFTVNPCTPIISSLTPASALAGGGSFTLTVRGSKCMRSATVNWNGAPLVTTVLSSGVVTAVVPAENIASVGAASITLSNPSAAPSSALTFQIAAPPTPKISALNPNTAAVTPASTGAASAQNAPSVQILVTGSNFNARSVVCWNGAALPTAFVSVTSLKATIPAANLTAAATASITVKDPNYGVSSPAPFMVIVPPPSVTTLSPSSVNSGATNFTLTVNGSDFQPGSVIRWSNMSLPTTFVSPTQLTATVAASMVWTPTTAPVVVCTTLSGKMVATAPLTFTVNPSTPIISTLNPPSKVAGAAAFTLTVTGAKCLKGATINWNGAPLATTIIASGVLQATISTDMIATAGSAAITLANPGSASSAPLTLQITNLSGTGSSAKS
ncbi:hypothetical protein CCAX7_009640 [Capsulimonas corticalis]|uniref:Uncharacterized protein n=1 Tax=Capsulimonas corticalis TaxID=2219043 RepID=A0A402CU85_9BACT|nr:IPT/TIG domain-containing protein [Capsulimonas corticalis]BDI28913.1 hypothetical protein CCAX7_009640 [Capsulimonas corticalis]